MDRSRLAAQLIDHEGMRLKPYRCTAGKLTIGVGRNLDDRGISDREARALLDNDIARVEGELDAYLPFWRSLSETRQLVIADMAFNIGVSGLLQFKQMIIALRAGAFGIAVDEMMESLWARQVGKRAETLARMMREG